MCRSSGKNATANEETANHNKNTSSTKWIDECCVLFIVLSNSVLVFLKETDFLLVAPG